MYEFIRNVFAVPFGFALRFLYNITGSYILAIVLLTVLLKLLLMPFSIKQQKTSAKQVRLNTKVNKIRQKYAGNQQKIQEETQALYQREGFSAANMGCTTMIIPLVVMIGLYGVIYTPLSSVLGFAASKIEDMKTIMASVLPDLADKANANAARMIEINILKDFDQFKDQLAAKLTAQDIQDLIHLKEKFTFFGIDLAGQPDKSHPDILWLIPILAFASAMLSSVYMFIKQKQQNPDMAKNPSMGCMTFMSPVMSLVFTFMFPAGVGFYWIISNLLGFVQQVVLSTLYSPKKVIAQQMVEETIVRRSKENITKLRAKNDDK